MRTLLTAVLLALATPVFAVSTQVQGWQIQDGTIEHVDLSTTVNTNIAIGTTAVAALATSTTAIAASTTALAAGSATTYLHVDGSNSMTGTLNGTALAMSTGTFTDCVRVNQGQNQAIVGCGNAISFFNGQSHLHADGSGGTTVNYGTSSMTVTGSAIQVVVNGVEITRVTDNGLGISVTTPQTKLDVNGDAQFGLGAVKSTFTAQGSLRVPYNVSAASASLTNFLDLSSASASSPAAGVARVRGATTQGYTRIVLDDEGTTETVVGRDNYLVVRNTSGRTLQKGEAVDVTGTTGNVPEVGPANPANSTLMPAIGVMIDDVANNAFGRAMSVGVLTSTNTAAWSVGTRLYVSPTSPGGWTSTRPVAPLQAQRIGVVLNSHATQGSIAVVVSPFVGGQESGTTSSFTVAGAGGLGVTYGITAGSVTTTNGFFGDGSKLTGIPSTASISGVYLPLAGGTMTGQIAVPDGHAAAPAIYRAADADSGIFFNGNDIGFSINGTTRATVGLSTGLCGGTGASTGNICLRSATAGTASDPQLQFANDGNTGLGRTAADNIFLTAGGTMIASMTATEFHIAPGTVLASSFAAGGYSAKLSSGIYINGPVVFGPMGYTKYSDNTVSTTSASGGGGIVASDIYQVWQTTNPTSASSSTFHSVDLATYNYYLEFTLKNGSNSDIHIAVNGDTGSNYHYGGRVDNSAATGAQVSADPGAHCELTYHSGTRVIANTGASCQVYISKDEGSANNAIINSNCGYKNDSSQYENARVTCIYTGAATVSKFAVVAVAGSHTGNIKLFRSTR